MKRKKPASRHLAPELSAADIEKLLKRIGKQISQKRKARQSLESFAYEINVSRSAMTGYEKGNDMYLSTFLKLLHGLEIEPADFFKSL